MEKKTRGVFITIILILYLIGAAFGLLGVVTNILGGSAIPGAEVSTGTLVYSIVKVVGIIPIVIGIFMWKKVAVYALAVYEPIIFILGLIITDFRAAAEQSAALVEGINVEAVMTTSVVTYVIYGVIWIALAYLVVFMALKKIKHNEEIENSMNV